MLDVVNDIGMQIEKRFANSRVTGATLEERLTSVLRVLSLHYEQSSYLVQMQILLDLSVNPKMSTRAQKAIRREGGQVVDGLAQPLMEKALGDVAAEHDLVLYAFMTMRGYLISCAVARLITSMPKNSVVRLIGPDTDEKILRKLMIRGVTETIREEATLRGYSID